MPTITLESTAEAWADTGVTVPEGGGLTAVCAGSYYWNPDSANGGGLAPPSASPGANLALFPASSARVNIYGAALLLLPVGDVPGAHPQNGGPQYADGVAGFAFDPDEPSVSLVLPAAQVAALAAETGPPGARRVWAIISDDDPDNNGGELELTLEAVPPPPPNELPQGNCNGDEFALEAEEATPTNPAALWQILRDGVEVDSGTSFDRPGRGGWVVQYPPPSEGLGALFVSAPSGADVGGGYQAVVDLIDEHPTVSFAVVEGSCAGPDPGTPAMKRYAFDSGTLYGFKGLTNAAPPALTRTAVGAPPAASDPLANLLDADPATTADFPATDGANYRYLRLDFGAAVSVGQVVAENVTLSGGAGAKAVKCYGAATAITDGDFSGATEVPADAAAPQANPITGKRLVWSVAGGGVATFRYFYLVPENATAVSFGGVEARGQAVSFAVLQDISFGVSFEGAELRASAHETLFPLLLAHHSGTIELSARWAEFNADSLRELSGGTLSGADPRVLTLDTATAGQAAGPAFFDAEFHGRAVDEDDERKNVLLKVYRAKAPGFRFSAPRQDFAMPDFTARVYFSKDSAAGAVLMIEQ